MNEQMDSHSAFTRREFLVASTAATLGFGLFGGRVTVGAEQADALFRGEGLAQHIHPKVRFRLKSIPDEQNAFRQWWEASQRITPLEEFAETFPKRDGEDFSDAIGSVDKPDKAFPTGDAGDCVREWLAAQDEAFLLIGQGLKRDRFQFPESHLIATMEGAFEPDITFILRNLVKLMRTRARRNLADGDMEAALADVLDLIRMTEMLAGCQGFLVHYLFCANARSIALDAALTYARQPLAPPASLAQLATALPRCQFPADMVADAFRAECLYFVSHVAAFDDQDLSATIESMIKRNREHSDPEDVEHVRSASLKLFEGHPAPFSRADTVRLRSEVVAQMIDDLAAPGDERTLKRRTPRFEEERFKEERWLTQLDQSVPYRQHVSDVIRSLLGAGSAEFEEASEQQLQAARTALQKIQNPLGKSLMFSLTDFDGVRMYRGARLQTDAACVVVATRRFVDTKGNLPERLADLIDTGLLTSVPIDLFTGDPIAYDRERGVIWSVGDGEPYDSGSDKPENWPEKAQFVWPLPTPKK